MAYTAGCAARSIAVGNTVFNDPATTSVRPDGALPYGDLTIDPAKSLVRKLDNAAPEEDDLL